MNHELPDNTTDLTQLLERADVWRGYSQRFAPQAVIDTGYAALNAGLLCRGWPVGCLVEICQQNLAHTEWLLLTPALHKTPGGFIVLLNPPAMPFGQALVQMGLDLERILIVQTANKADFLASFLELARAQACDAVLAWQPRQPLSYTELRKCLLATAEGTGLYVLFRPASMREQSSPASLRLLVELTAADLQVTIFKQKASLQTGQQGAINLTLPLLWKGLLPHHRLDQNLRPPKTKKSRTRARPKLKLVPSMGRGKS